MVLKYLQVDLNRILITMSPILDTELLSATASDLQQQLHDGTLTSIKLVERYLAHIAAHNYKGMSLHALISTAPEDNVLAIARQLDDERKAGTVRSALHGIPMVLKVCGAVTSYYRQSALC